ncbi:hypothetical protein FOMPIDRAFT_131400 [Fomitopsis schrenkii]|uniref:Uncharacterized protein n=1 Tax=Fomitopsis schrenkii TaxID=2126942 RepID=S8DND7_FOMSC|nr:hypothetical protein FOMPIDRAFT_131400 [Fomitopsis schrenkii]
MACAQCTILRTSSGYSPTVCSHCTWRRSFLFRPCDQLTVLSAQTRTTEYASSLAA